MRLARLLTTRACGGEETGAEQQHAGGLRSNDSRVGRAVSAAALADERFAVTVLLTRELKTLDVQPESNTAAEEEGIDVSLILFVQKIQDDGERFPAERAVLRCWRISPE